MDSTTLAIMGEGSVLVRRRCWRRRLNLVGGLKLFDLDAGRGTHTGEIEEGRDDCGDGDGG